MPPQAAKWCPALKELTCTLCRKTFNLRGHSRHKGACQKNKKWQEADLACTCTNDAASGNDAASTDAGSAEVDVSGKCELGSVINVFAHLGPVGSGVQIPNIGDIVIEYHPHSGKERRFFSPEKFKASLRDDLGHTGPPDDEPWHPFCVRKDFEFVEQVNNAALNQPQTEKLIKFIWSCQDDDRTVTNITLRS